MRKLLTTLSLSTFLVGASFVTAAYAADNTQDTAATSTAEANQVSNGALADEIVGIKPQVGILAYTDQLGNGTSRAAAGISLEMNAVPLVDNTLKQWYIGPSTGFIYSHLGAASSNLFGTNSDSSLSLDTGANMVLIPVDLKVGYAFADNLRVSAHGGGNVFYVSDDNAINTGTTPVGASRWSMYPDVGADLEWGVAKNVSLLLRPDLTFTPGSDIFAGMIGVGIQLG